MVRYYLEEWVGRLMFPEFLVHLGSEVFLEHLMLKVSVHPEF